MSGWTNPLSGMPSPSSWLARSPDPLTEGIDRDVLCQDDFDVGLTQLCVGSCRPALGRPSDQHIRSYSSRSRTGQPVQRALAGLPAHGGVGPPLKTAFGVPDRIVLNGSS